MALPAELFGVIGFPLAQTMSPLLHNWAFERAGLAGVYMAWQIPPEKLADFFTAVRTLPIQGGNITIPHKVAAMSLLDEVSSGAGSAGAVNVFYWEQGRLCGENTDVPGFLSPIRKRSFRSALVLGAGGASRAVLTALKEMGVPDIAVTNRTAGKADALAAEFGVHHFPWTDRAHSGADLIINSTSQGMKDKDSENSPFPKEGFKGKGLAYDIIYNPLETRFLKEARDSGWDIQDGLAMFVEQARESFRIWNKGGDLPPDAAAALVKEKLAL